MATVALSGIITPTNVVTTTSTSTLTNKTLSSPTITGVSTFAAGTAALPALTTTGDTNTGIFFPAADTIAFTEGGTESMRISSSGNLGIGTSSPAKILHVVGTSPVVILEPTLGSQDSFINIGRYSLSGTVALTSTKAFLEFGFEGNDDTFSTGIESRVITSASRINSAADLGFFTKVAGGNLKLERMTITPAGNVLIATTTSPSSSGVGSGFVIDSDGRASLIMRTNTTSGRNLCDFGNPNGSVGSISVSGSATAYNTSSDYRLKNTIAPMTGALAKVALLKPCTYKWNADGSDGQGFIAHELAEIVPQCVTGAKDAVDAEGKPQYQGIDVSFLVATLTAAIQELKAEFDAYKASHP
jgi:hypothetical protein